MKNKLISFPALTAVFVFLPGFFSIIQAYTPNQPVPFIPKHKGDIQISLSGTIGQIEIWPSSYFYGGNEGNFNAALTSHLALTASLMTADGEAEPDHMIEAGLGYLVYQKKYFNVMAFMGYGNGNHKGNFYPVQALSGFFLSEATVKFNRIHFQTIVSRYSKIFEGSPGIQIDYGIAFRYSILNYFDQNFEFYASFNKKQQLYEPSVYFRVGGKLKGRIQVTLAFPSSRDFDKVQKTMVAFGVDYVFNVFKHKMEAEKL